MRRISNPELQRLSVGEFKKSKKIPFIVVLDNVRSMNNVGSVFRTADAFSAEAIYLCGITACPPHREIHKTALGSTDSVVWKYFHQTEEALIELRNSGYHVMVIEQVEPSIKLNKFSPIPEKKYALVFGNEVMGVREELLQYADGAIEIPQTGTKHSLNIAVSAGIVLWECFNKSK